VYHHNYPPLNEREKIVLFFEINVSQMNEDKFKAPAHFKKRLKNACMHIFKESL